MYVGTRPILLRNENVVCESLEMLMNYIHRLISTYLKCKANLKEYFRWRKHRVSRANEPIVCFGHNNVPSRGEKASGGIIKCQDLLQRFQNNFSDSNLLYLVSSALPDYSQYIVRNAKKRSVKLVWNQNGVAYPAWHGPGWERTNLPLAKGLSQADYVIYQSEFCKHASDRYLGEFQGPYKILYNPVDTSVFCPAKSKSLGQTILLAGTHNEWYRVRVALKAFNELLSQFPGAVLLIAGPLRWRIPYHDARKEADEYCRQLYIEGKVHFLGAYSQQDAVEMFRSADILLHTQYNDACPRLVVEAMACGLPVVYSATGGTPELVGSDAGIGIPGPVDWEQIHEADPSVLSAALCDIFNNYERYSVCARQRAVERFDVSDWLNAHDKIFRSLLT